MRKDKYQNENEIFANAVTAEILLPEDKFLRQWQEHNLTPLEKIIKISEQELVSMTVVARTALENHLINQNKYQEAVKMNISYAEEARKHAKEKSGGDFHNTKLSRIDVNFLYALSNGLNTGTANFTDVYKLTGLSRKNYNTIEQINSEGVINLGKSTLCYRCKCTHRISPNLLPI